MIPVEKVNDSARRSEITRKVIERKKDKAVLKGSAKSPWPTNAFSSERAKEAARKRWDREAERF